MTKDFFKTPLLDILTQSTHRKHAAFYAPGHKQGKGISHKIQDLIGKQVFQADLPELPELDNLFASAGAIAAAQELAAQTFGATKTWFLINGSTSGIIAAILATCGMGEKIILPRNIHQSAIAGLILSGAIPIFINPEYDPQEELAYNVTPAAVKQALEQHPDTKAVMMLHPTYQGICSDLKAIADLTHSYQIPLLVDEAHGAHFTFHADLPPSALSVGADLTVQSTHKTLSSLTQSSMLHLQGNRVCSQRISKALQLVQSTSPSYLLLASLDAARQQMATEGKELMNEAIALAHLASQKIAEIPKLSVLNPQIQPGCHYCDPTRLTINISQLGITGFEADEILHEQLNVTCELPLLQHLTLIISLGNIPEDIQRLIEACQILSLSASGYQLAAISYQPSSSTLHPTKVSPRQAYFMSTETIQIEQAGDRLCGELICPYPPGIPVLMPGEVITSEVINYLQQIVAAGGTITGCNDPSLRTIQTLK
ncbi:lysine decarboxylase [Pleurocapsa sp. CCALA 161]|uniref:aminotransferase class I/II-fold pyridoxal phosphate-dependent enzyme n=1 Tax=Pleurocapsa sp. CCALA 161 TaxID=2107688 RepID=UPI000D054833|nr:aminotransferase class I/II-fold pyridoxal phosphate-dependent enzyme [Pleurocapsa sp. CCALA 161]PSB07424.1 lysine decarboxylase [Pleurocapsa sp. CCALA 161]